MRVAIAGLGSACMRAHLPALARLEAEGAAAVVAAADPNPERRAALAELQPRVPTYRQLEDLLMASAPDVLVIATDPRLHPALVELGIGYGCHVVCEKPVALTEAGQRRIARACGERPDLALVPVHQYRYSPQWVRIWRWARLAARLGLPYALSAEVQRVSGDRNAITAWRGEADCGGMLADAGVHFIALAATIGAPLTALEGVRIRESRSGERVTARAALDSGRLTIRLWRGAPRRHTRIHLRLPGTAIVWSDRTSRVKVGPLPLPPRRVEALSDRSHVDTLYGSLYRELAERLPNPAWRGRRTAEALAVGETLVALLAQPSLSAEAIA